MSDIPEITKPHPWLILRRSRGPVKVEDQHHDSLNGRIALTLTRVVSTMWCAYVFAVLALWVLPDAIKGGTLTLVQWVSQTFIQLVMLSVIMVGQAVAGKAADERAVQTYNDAESILHEMARFHARLDAIQSTPQVNGENNVTVPPVSS